MGSLNISPSGNFLAFNDNDHLQSHLFVFFLRSTAPRDLHSPSRLQANFVLLSLLLSFEPSMQLHDVKKTVKKSPRFCPFSNFVIGDKTAATRSTWTPWRHTARIIVTNDRRTDLFVHK
jgi:hypothetical protein